MPEAQPPVPSDRPRPWLVPIDEVAGSISRDVVAELVRRGQITPWRILESIWVDRLAVLAALADPMPAATALAEIEAGDQYCTIPECVRSLRHHFPVLTERQLRHYARTGKVTSHSRNRAKRLIYPMFYLEVHWAPRPKEARNLDVGNWTSASRRLHLTRTKNGEERSFVVDPETAKLLDACAAGRPRHEPLFRAAQGGRWIVKKQAKLIRWVLNKLNIAGSLYSARHHACTMIAKLLQGDVPKIKSITGHLTLSELDRYLHDFEEDDSAARAWDKYRYRAVAAEVESNQIATQALGSKILRGPGASGVTSAG